MPEPGRATSEDPTRRGLLAGSLLAAGLAVARPARAVADATAEQPSDPDLLTGLLGVEALVATVYERVLASGRLSPRAHRLAQRVLAQEHAHAAALTTQLALFGGTPPSPHVGPSALEAELGRHRITMKVDALGGEKDALKLLTQVERVAEGAYFAALSKLGHPRLLTLGAEILASEAQHFTLVAQILHPRDLGFTKTVPDPFVQGRK